MCLQYKITPVWVFDGKPPQEKFDDLQRRNQRGKQQKKNQNKLDSKGKCLTF